ncbi:MAG: hypothetical protein J5972_00715, partial [Eubacterium sp.]|nr:hypothetical protein [Eubacterium sp.]
MKNIIRELQKGKNVPDNLKKFVVVAMETNQAYSGLELTFSAYTLVEEMQEEKQELAVQEKESLQCLLTGLRQLSEAGGVDETLMEEMKQLRTVITDKMDLFTAYVDRLICYEYILNR